MEKKIPAKKFFFHIHCQSYSSLLQGYNQWGVYSLKTYIQGRKKKYPSTVSDWRTWNPDSWQDAHVEVFSEGGTQLINEIRRLGNLSFLNAYTLCNQIENLPKHTHHLHP